VSDAWHAWAKAAAARHPDSSMGCNCAQPCNQQAAGATL
jgi:hypothetical protein